MVKFFVNQSSLLSVSSVEADATQQQHSTLHWLALEQLSTSHHRPAAAPSQSQPSHSILGLDLNRNYLIFNIDFGREKVIKPGIFFYKTSYLIYILRNFHGSPYFRTAPGIWWYLVPTGWRFKRLKLTTRWRIITHFKKYYKWRLHTWTWSPAHSTG